jgi:predicted RNase H-like HicB family nuclease
MVAMKKIIQVHIHKGEKYYVAECLDLPVVTQAETLDELADNLKEALALHLEGEDLSELDLAPDAAILASFELEPLIHAEA